MSQSSDARETRASVAEVKFLIEPELGAAIRAWARHRLGPDPHGIGEFGDQYRTTSVYFDTADYDVFYRRGSFGRSKFRARRYDCTDAVFLERKLTKPGLVTKRRTRVSQAELRRLDAVDRDRTWAGDWFLRRLRLRNLRPVCQVSYHRTARVLATERGPIRLTLDEQVRALPFAGLSFGGGLGAPVVGERLILELKYSVKMPEAFETLVERFGLVPQTASKYRLGVVALGYAPGLPRT